MTPVQTKNCQLHAIFNNFVQDFNLLIKRMKVKKKEMKAGL